MAVIPLIFNASASAATGAAIYAELNTIFGASPGNYSYISPVPSGGESAMRLRIDAAGANHDIVIKLDASGNLLVYADSDASISDPLSPNGTDQSPACQWLDASDLSNLGTDIRVAVYDDAITVLVKNSAGDAFERGFHAGAGVQVGLALGDGSTTDDDGLIVLAGKPYDDRQNVNSAWFFTSVSGTNNHSYIHMAAGEWVRPSILVHPSSFTEENTIRRFSPMPVGGASDGGYFLNSSILGFLKYIVADTKTNTAPLNSSPSTATDQAILRVHFLSGDDTRNVHIWNKTLTI